MVGKSDTLGNRPAFKSRSTTSKLCDFGQVYFHLWASIQGTKLHWLKKDLIARTAILHALVGASYLTTFSPMLLLLFSS